MKLSLICIIILLIGCDTVPVKPDIQYKTVDNYIAVFTVPDNLKNIVIPERPVLDNSSLTVENKKTPDVVIQKQLSTINQLQKYSEDLEKSLSLYRAAVNIAQDKQDKK